MAVPVLHLFEDPCITPFPSPKQQTYITHTCHLFLPDTFLNYSAVEAVGDTPWRIYHSSPSNTLQTSRAGKTVRLQWTMLLKQAGHFLHRPVMPPCNSLLGRWADGRARLLRRGKTCLPSAAQTPCLPSPSLPRHLSIEEDLLAQPSSLALLGWKDVWRAWEWPWKGRDRGTWDYMAGMPSSLP